MTDAVRFIQFLHPGTEHRPEANGWKPWTTEGHRRAFVVQRGTYMRRLDEGSPFPAELHFWCEWECEAEAVGHFASQPGYPRFLFRPCIRPRKRFKNHANTDPCVFGDRFRYCVCQQDSRPSLKHLAPGSVIVFGSRLDGEFVIDTVFVVARSYVYSKRTHRSLPVPELYHNAAIAPLFGGGCGDGEEYQLYEGATPADPFAGMFSFFPCLPADESAGFPRPSIRLPGVVNPRHSQGIKMISPISPSRASELWRSVAVQVVGQGLCLGVSAEMPAEMPAELR